jgi:hypothetical protein
LCLLIHEFIGHGLPVALFDGQVLSVYISFFGKAWLHFEYSNNPSFIEILFISLGGVLIEVFLACTLLFGSKYFNSRIKFYSVAFASMLLIHSLSYITFAMHLGHADGDIVYRYTSDGTRNLLALVLACITVIITYLCSYNFGAYIHALMNNHSKIMSLTKFLGAMFIAGALSIGLMVLEENLIKNDVREKIFTAKYVEELTTLVKRKQEHLERPLNAQELKDIKEKVTPYPLPLYTSIAMFFAAIFGYLKHKGLRLSDFDCESLSLKYLFTIQFIILMSISILRYTH